MAQADYILGIDYGEKRIGIAVAHGIARLPRQLTTLSNSPEVVGEIQQLVAREGIGLVVVGLPRSMDGRLHAQAERVEGFAAKLAQTIQVPVKLVDETLTSIQAEQILTNGAKNKNLAKGSIDAMSAALILERYFEEHQTTGGDA